MTERQNQILKILAKSIDYITSVQISNNIGVSEKTVREDLKVLREYLSDYNIELNSRRGLGFRIICESYEDRDFIYNLLEHQEPQSKDVFLYKSLIVCILFCKNDYVTQESLKNELFIPKRYLQRLIIEFNKELSPYEVEIKTYKARGYYLVGQEIKKRMAFVSHFIKIKSEYLFLNIFNKTTDFSSFYINKNMLEGTYNNINSPYCSITEKNLERLNLYLIVVRYRQNKGLKVESPDSNCILPDKEVNRLAKEIFDLNGFLPDQNEVEMFSFLLLILSEHSEDFKSLSFEFTSAYDPILEHIHSFFERRLELYNQLFENTLTMENKLKYYLALILEGNKLGVTRSSPNEENLDDDFYVSVEFTTLLMLGIENKFGYRFTKENIFVLATVVNSIFAYNIWNRKRIIYIQSRESNLHAQALKRRIASALNKLVDIRCIPWGMNVMEEVASSEITILITDDLNAVAHQRVMRYRNLFMYSNIIDSLSKLLVSSSRGIERFIKYFKEENFHVIPKSNSIDELIELTCCKYKCSRHRTDTILKNVYTRESRYFSITKNGLCIPQIYIDSVDRPLFEVFIPEEPFYWNGNTIWLLMIFILPGSYWGLINAKRFSSLLYENIHEIQTLRKSCDFQDFINEMLNYIKTNA